MTHYNRLQTNAILPCYMPSCVMNRSALVRIIQLPCWDSQWKIWSKRWNKITSVQRRTIFFLPACSPMSYLKLWILFHIPKLINFIKCEVIGILPKSVYITEYQLQMAQQIIDLNKARAFIVTSQCSTCSHCDVTMQHMLLLWRHNAAHAFIVIWIIKKVLCLWSIST